MRIILAVVFTVLAYFGICLVLSVKLQNEYPDISPEAFGQLARLTGFHYARYLLTAAPALGIAAAAVIPLSFRQRGRFLASAVLAGAVAAGSAWVIVAAPPLWAGRATPADGPGGGADSAAPPPVIQRHIPSAEPDRTFRP